MAQDPPAPRARASDRPAPSFRGAPLTVAFFYGISFPCWRQSWTALAVTLVGGRQKTRREGPHATPLRAKAPHEQTRLWVLWSI